MNSSSDRCASWTDVGVDRCTTRADDGVNRRAARADDGVDGRAARADDGIDRRATRADCCTAKRERGSTRLMSIPRLGCRGRDGMSIASDMLVANNVR